MAKTEIWAITREGITHIIEAKDGHHASLIANEWVRLNCWHCPYCEQCILNHHGDCATN